MKNLHVYLSSQDIIQIHLREGIRKEGVHLKPLTPKSLLSSIKVLLREANINANLKYGKYLKKKINFLKFGRSSIMSKI